MSLWTFLKDREDSISNIKNRNYEFKAELENHPLGEQNIYRFYFIEYHRIGENYGMGPDNVGVFNAPFKPFMLPGNMSRADAFKILSYFNDYVANNYELKGVSYKSVSALDSLLDIPSLGFRRININLDKDSDFVCAIKEKGVLV